LLALILFILVFLSLPLLLFYLANTSYEEQHNQLSRASGGGSGPNSTRPTPTNQTQANQTEANAGYPAHSSIEFQPINCTQYASQANLSLADENCE